MSIASELRPDEADPRAQELWRDSLEAFRERDYPRAAQLMQTLLADFGEQTGGVNAASVHQQLGITLLRLERPEEGVAELLRSVRLNPYDGRTRYKLGIGLARLGRNEEALASLDQAVKLAPDVADHRWRLAEELRRQGQEFEAREHARTALELDPDHAEAKETLKALKGAELRAIGRWLKRFA